MRLSTQCWTISSGWTDPFNTIRSDTTLDLSSHKSNKDCGKNHRHWFFPLNATQPLVRVLKGTDSISKHYKGRAEPSSPWKDLQSGPVKVLTTILWAGTVRLSKKKKSFPLIETSCPSPSRLLPIHRSLCTLCMSSPNTKASVNGQDREHSKLSSWSTINQLGVNDRDKSMRWRHLGGLNSWYA